MKFGDLKLNDTLILVTVDKGLSIDKTEMTITGLSVANKNTDGKITSIEIVTDSVSDPVLSVDKSFELEEYHDEFHFYMTEYNPKRIKTEISKLISSRLAELEGDE